MCGISGILSTNRGPKVQKDHLKLMSDSMIHRGPDDSGIYQNSDKTVGFSFRRLSIIDLKSGHQPMSTEDNNLWIVFNGEIYNHLTLRNELKNKGYYFRTQADTETIIYGYKEWGADVVNHLRGMFAFAIWDEKAKNLFLARDRIGIKPLYYFNSNQFVFSSEIKAITSLPFINKKMNEEALYHYLTFAVSPAPMTMFENIQKLEPGHTLSIKQDGNIEKKKYWEPIVDSNSINKMSENEIIEELRKLLRESIRLRMMSDVPYGVFLSGGVDSSINVALMNEFSDIPVNTFSVAIKDDSLSDESSEAKKIAEHFHTNHHDISITSQDFIDFLPKMVKYQDEPMADPVCVPLYFVSKLARENGVYVIQVGEGADEIFSGYSLYAILDNFYNRYYQPFSRLSSPLKKLCLGIGRFILPKRKLKYLDWAANDKELFWGGANVFSEKEKSTIISIDSNYDSYAQIIEPHYKYFNQNRFNSKFIDKMIYLELKHRLPELLLMRVDKMAMATSVETRVPYLDHHLVEFALGIPSTLKYKNGITKYILKEASRGIIPDHVISREKNGFCGSASNMISQEVLTYAQTQIMNSEWMNEYFNMDEIFPMFDEHRSKNKDNGMQIFNLLNVALWQREWFN